MDLSGTGMEHIMKMNVTLTIEVDPKAWDQSYGSGSSVSEVRADVREYVHNQVQQSAGILETEAIVTIK
jgi:hypothetical protein